MDLGHLHSDAVGLSTGETHGARGRTTESRRDAEGVSSARMAESHWDAGGGGGASGETHGRGGRMAESHRDAEE
eukprot:14283219-Alexandrium_andersonii.AAC.1